MFLECGNVWAKLERKGGLWVSGEESRTVGRAEKLMQKCWGWVYLKVWEQKGQCGWPAVRREPGHEFRGLSPGVTVCVGTWKPRRRNEPDWAVSSPGETSLKFIDFCMTVPELEKNVWREKLQACGCLYEVMIFFFWVKLCSSEKHIKFQCLDDLFWNLADTFKIKNNLFLLNPELREFYILKGNLLTSFLNYSSINLLCMPPRSAT